MHKGFVYLTAIIDWHSRFVLDWQLSINMEADFCIETLGRVLASTHCEIFNTDQGAQFTSKGFTDLLLENNVQLAWMEKDVGLITYSSKDFGAQ